MTYLECTHRGQWDIKWSCFGLGEDANYIALFNCGNFGSNVMIPMEDLKDMIVNKKPSIVPHDVMVKAMAILSDDLKNQIQEKIVA